MITTANDIFHEIQPEGHSMSLARRYIAEEAVKFNGELVTSMCQELDVKQGDKFSVGKRLEWIRAVVAGARGDESECWVKIRLPIRDDERIKDHEGILRLGAYYLVFPKHPAECSYVRIVDCSGLAEIAYWSVTEWEEAGAEVMGAIIGVMCEGYKKVGIFS